MTSHEACSALFNWLQCLHRYPYQAGTPLVCQGFDSFDVLMRGEGLLQRCPGAIQLFKVWGGMCVVYSVPPRLLYWQPAVLTEEGMAMCTPKDVLLLVFPVNGAFPEFVSATWLCVAAAWFIAWECRGPALPCNSHS